MKIIKNFIVDGKHKKPIVTDVFFEETNQPKPVVIFCHGYKGFKDWGAWNTMAEAFAKAGFFFIKFNFSHNGGTVNQPIDFPDLEAFGNNNYTIELDDLESIIDWASSNTEYKNEIDLENISLIGHSRAGGIVTIKSRENNQIKKVISLAGVCDFEKRTATSGDVEQWKKEGVKYVLNGRTKQQMPHFYQFYEDFKLNEDRLNIQTAVFNLSIPYLIIHGDKDTSVSLEEAKKLHSWNSKNQLEIIENANHVFNISHPWEQTELSKELNKVTQICVGFLRNL
ncbi:MAG: alpha/beta hydrolase fold domain-containing protein [Polaribacter sp.]|nr:alpha/beta hydrolase fold domain-containing protein [Polaribacter sp.]MDG1811837.1 alpha/beta hydrolase fold domain-containing protein [Polaribacter sp.]MDG1994618.1 alpha/beta hydrolase fold domain-containing protein [Polaribacter sp.]